MIALSHNSLGNYYQMLATLTYYHKYTLDDIESCMPWERDVYVKLIIQFMKTDEEARKAAEH